MPLGFGLMTGFGECKNVVIETLEKLENKKIVVGVEFMQLWMGKKQTVHMLLAWKFVISAMSGWFNCFESNLHPPSFYGSP